MIFVGGTQKFLAIVYKVNYKARVDTNFTLLNFSHLAKASFAKQFNKLEISQVEAPDGRRVRVR